MFRSAQHVIRRSAFPRLQLQQSCQQRNATAGGNSLLKSDEGPLSTSTYHKVNMLIMGLTPVAFALSPSKLNLPIDVLLGLALPLHAHIGMSYVITDYVPKISKSLTGPARVLLLGLTGVTTVGLLKLNIFGDGMTETVKSLWRGKKKLEEKRKA
ncbi:hypothetical protein TrST_g6911 [Triparma strigata]|uniref:Succinate dehydrogenase [ubiquinone] cytochrome b small subunit n=1 Tax=Triparma strigata TaxID=1606541 RepID=A0A9W7BEL8_9STRA|nr:hypothetical protein TrST_g6911 [Triparma strigata]